MELLDPAAFGQNQGLTVQRQGWRPTLVATHLDRVPRCRTHATAQGLQDGLLGGEAGGESFGPTTRVTTLLEGEEPGRECGTALQGQRESSDVDDVNPHPDSRHYSTVTVLARLRGRSTLRPSPRAIEYASICKGTTSIMGLNIGSVAGTRNT